MRKALIMIMVALSLLNLKGQEAQDSLESFVEGREDTTTVKILRLKINSSKPDFSPFKVKNELNFVSGRNREVGVDYVDANGDSEITDLYKATETEPGKYRNLKLFDGRLNTKYYEGPFCINKEGTVIYYTANDKRSGLLKIYKSEKINGKWSRSEMMPFCKDDFSYFHPALTPDENSIIFSCDRNRKQSKIDLYKVSFTNGEWTEVVALNKFINDTNSQVFPFVSRNNTLYFATDKKTGTGMDIYSVPLDSANVIPRILPFPVNSKFDDFGIWIDSAGVSGYFSTNRIEKFKDDIYFFTNSMPDFTDAPVVIPKTQFCYSFVEESTLASSDTVNLTYEWDFGDGKKSRGLRTRHCFAGPGQYQVVLNVVDKVSGEIFVSETAYPLTIEKPNQLIADCKEMVLINEEVILTAKDPYIKNCKLDKICWSFGDGRYNSGSTVKHIYKTAGTYSVQLGVVVKNKETDQTQLYKIEKKITVVNATK